MLRLDKGALRLFRLFGIDVFLHWSWAAVAVIELMTRKNAYQSPIWNVAEYLTLFAIVLTHEFGHALACRSVGGKAERILLWPLGGVAYVAPPPRPGAVLWSIAAGPLVNLVLCFVLIPLAVVADLFGAPHDVHHYAIAVAAINVGLFVFNMLPIYPLDGGQIVQSLLWYVIGRARSLLVVSVIGMAVAGVGIVAALALGQTWLAIIAAFAVFRGWVGFQQARRLAQLEAAPRRTEAACPACGAHPPAGAFWRCACGTPIDAFSTGNCPRCMRGHDQASCVACNQLSPIDAWLRKSA